MNKLPIFHPRRFPGRSDIYVVFIMGIIIAASVYLVGGLIPDIEEQPSADAKEYSVTIEKRGKNPGIGMQLIELKSRPVPTVPIPTPGEDPTNPTGCSETMAVNFLVDVSDSMTGIGDGVAKIVSLRNALRAFYPDLPDRSIFGITSFATRVNQVVPIQEYAAAKGQIPGEIERLEPSGATYMRDGFELARDNLRGPMNLFKDHTFNLVVISDGVPELVECQEPYCEEGAGRNYDPSQDPTLPSNGNIVSEIKAMGVNIYTVAIYNTEDLEISNKLQQIMRDASSGNGYYYESADAKGLSDILGQIKDKTCRT